MYQPDFDSPLNISKCAPAQTSIWSSRRESWSFLPSNCPRLFPCSDPLSQCQRLPHSQWGSTGCGLITISSSSPTPLLSLTVILSLCLEHTGFKPALEPLHLLFPLPGMPLLHRVSSPSPPPGLCSKVPFKGRPSLTSSPAILHTPPPRPPHPLHNMTLCLFCFLSGSSP